MLTLKAWEHFCINPKPHKFGRLVDLLIRLSVSMENDKSIPPSKSISYFQSKYILPAERLRVCISGDYFNKKSTSGKDLSPDFFLTLLKIFVENQVITSRDEIKYFAQSAGDYIFKKSPVPYSNLLTKELIEILLKSQKCNVSQFHALKIPINRNQNREIINLILSPDNQNIFLLGHPGIGKTTFLLELLQTEKIVKAFNGFVFYANLQNHEPDAIITDWYFQFFQQKPSWNSSIHEMKQELKLALNNKKSLFLFDDVSNKEIFRDLLIHDPLLGSVVSAANNERVINMLVNNNKDRIIHLNGFTHDEFMDYLKFNWGKKIDNDELSLKYIEKIRVFLRGNPLALHFATLNAESLGWKALYSLLTDNLNGEIPSTMLEEIYLPMKLWYESSSEEMKSRFTQLGGLPYLREYDLFTFQSLWKLSEINTLDQIIKMDFVFEEITSSNNQNKMWFIHQQVFNFARHSFLKIENKTQKSNSEKWIKRYTKSTQFKNRFRIFLDSSQKLSVSEIANLMKNYSRSKVERQTKNITIFKSIEGKAIGKNSNVLSPQEFGLAYKLDQIEIFSRRIILSCLLLTPLLFVALYFSITNNNIPITKLILLSLFVDSLNICLFLFVYLKRFQILWNYLYRLIIEYSVDKPSSDQFSYKKGGGLLQYILTISPILSIIIIFLFLFLGLFFLFI